MTYRDDSSGGDLETNDVADDANRNKLPSRPLPTRLSRATVGRPFFFSFQLISSAAATGSDGSGCLVNESQRAISAPETIQRPVGFSVKNRKKTKQELNENAATLTGLFIAN